MHILGDLAYPQSAWLMTRFRGDAFLTSEQVKFNKALSSGREVVERAFGLLKNKWKKLRYLVADPEKAAKEVAACVYLHNFLLGEEADGDGGSDDGGDDVEGVGDAIGRENMDKRGQFLNLFIGDDDGPP